MVVNAAINAANIRVRRGKQTLFNGLNFTIPRGQVVGLLGPSGCGKTTLLRAIVGIQHGVSGQLTVLGQPAGARGLRSRVSYATQTAAVYDDLTVRQNLNFFAKTLEQPNSEIDRVLHQVNLNAQANQTVAALSGGQRNRVSLAVALLGAPELVVLDEPTVGLDPLLRAELWDLFTSLAKRGTTLIVSSHVMDEALRCDRLLLLRNGQLIADTTPTQLLASTGQTDPESAFLTIIKTQHTP